MKIFKPANRLVACVVALVIMATPMLAQHRRISPRKPPVPVPEPAPSFDSLLAADSYKVYCEIRGVGGLVRSSAVNDLLDPIIKLGGPPKEFKTVVKWLSAHAEALAGSRMLVAGWSSRPNLPNFLIAIEFSSPEEAKKFYPELRDFLPRILPTPTPAPSPTPVVIPAVQTTNTVSANPSETSVMGTRQTVATVAEEEPGPTLPPYQMKQAGSLVLISDSAFTFKNLRPRGSKALEEDQNFLLARNRFASESLFLYVDLKAIEKEQKEKRQKWEDEAQKQAEVEQKRAEAAANPPTEEPVIETTDPEITAVPVEEPALPPEPPPSEQPTIIATTAGPQASGDATLSGGPQPSVDEAMALSSLSRMLFGGQSKWPEAVGAALVFEGDAYVLRTLIINSAENKGIAIPFVPQFVSGPAIAPESPNIFPADVELFASVSLDYPLIYEGMLQAFGLEEQEKKSLGPQHRPASGGPAETPFSYYEKKLGLKIKDDLLPLLGNELALALPKRSRKATNDAVTNTTVNAATGESVPQDAPNGPNAGPNPLIAIAIKDREAVGRLIPKIIEEFGLKGASLLAQTERREGTEIVSYAGAFAYAFVGDFLVFSPDPAETRHVVDAYLTHQTLSSDSHFRNYTRWQPRQVLGQVYVAPGLVAEYTVGSGRSGAALDKVNASFSGVNPVIDPLTYTLSNDGLGPFHELHVPKNLLQVLVGEILVGASEAMPSSNEAITRSHMQSLANAEMAFKSTEGNSGYGTLDQLVSAGLYSTEMLEKYGYRISVSASLDKFEITAVPVEYGTTGKLSFFIDESQILRGGDHGGGAATANDQPM